jgi:hypothetical protein
MGEYTVGGIIKIQPSDIALTKQLKLVVTWRRPILEIISQHIFLSERYSS